VEFAAESCPNGSIIGRAKAYSPILAQPLTGVAYLRSSSHELPDLVVALKGQVDFELSGRIDSVNGRLRSTFEAVPDVPVSRFVLNLEGGKTGLLINSNPLCAESKRATVRATGQNNALFKSKPKLRIACGKSGGRKKHRAQHRRSRALASGRVVGR
jgi:hypothetical protein